jgi:hypothetical protein
LIQQIIEKMQEVGFPSTYWIHSKAAPEFLELNLAKHTTNKRGQSVFDHTMIVIDFLPIKNPVTLFAGLFHDLGKCYVEPSMDSQVSRFHGHEIKSALIVAMKLAEWGASSDLIGRVMRLVSTHMYDIRDIKTEKAVRKFVADVGRDNIEDWFSLRYADSAAYSGYVRYHDRIIEPFRMKVMLFLEKQSNGDEFELANPGDIGNMRIEGKDTK